MKISISFFLCSAFYIQHSFAYAAVGPVVDDGHSCVILTPARCPKKNCDCKNYITFHPKSWYRAFLASVNGKKCKCESCVQKPKKVKCKNGVCDKKNQKCVCDYCWVGEVCDKFKNKYAPEFEDAQQVVSIPKSHPTHLPVTRVAAFDRDLNFCNGASCPCGEIVYKLRKDFGIFKIDTFTGAISITRTPDSSEYLLMVTASNNPDVDTAKEGNINVTIKVSDSPSVPLTDHEPDHTSHDIYDETEDVEYIYGDEEDHSHHSRKRRSVEDDTVHPLIVTAEPQLSTTYYFNKGERIVFRVKAMNNDTSTSITAIHIKASTVWLKLENLNLTAPTDPNARFTGTSDLSNNVANFRQSMLGPNQKYVMAEITGVVNASVTPLANLNLDLEVTYTFDSQTTTVQGLKSSPIVYGVFPEVNVTRQSYSVSTYEEVNVDMKMQLPLLNYRLLVELTSNVECFVFMEVKDVSVNHGSGISFSGTKVPVYHTSDKSNGMNDRAVIDFGDITVSDVAESERLITINYKLAVKDHANVANGSTHYAGAGLQAGPSILWVEQQDFEITKIEPALEVSYNKSAIDNSSRLFIGDLINIEYRVDHTSTSEEIAKKVKITLISEHLAPVTSGVYDTNGTHHSIKTVTDTLNLGKILSGVFAMEVRDTILPLMTLPTVLYVEYENDRGVKKFPLRMDVTLPLTGTPSCTFERINGQGDIVFGNEIEFEMIIWLSKMHASLQVEFVLPKYGNNSGNGTALMHILSIDMVNIGDNIKDGSGNKKTVVNNIRYYSTSDNARWRDQAVWDLGNVMHKASDVSNTSINQIVIRLKALVLEVQNVSSGTQFKVGAGVIGMPRMIWIGQIDTRVRLEPLRQPKMEFLHNVTDATKDEYGHEISFKHSSDSDQFAYNVTFEYYLPPYVEYIREDRKAANVIKSRNDRARFTYTGPFTFLDTVNHSIRVKLRREYSPKTGKFEFMVPCALTYTNYQHKRWQYWRSAKRNIHVRSRAPTIPRDNQAHKNYYGRGMYLDGNKNEIFVCMNMHLPSSRPACYRSTDNGNSWSAMDSRVGCVIGHHNNELYAIGRNQVIVIRYSAADKDWYLVNEDQKSNLGDPFKDYKDFSTVTTLEPSEMTTGHMSNNKLWGVTDEGVFYRPSTSDDWAKKANWRL